MGNHDVVRVAGPHRAPLLLAQGETNAVHALHEGRPARQLPHHLDAHTRHDAHVDRHVGAVRQLDTNLGEGRS